jgi:hypothetical protein
MKGRAYEQAMVREYERAIISDELRNWAIESNHYLHHIEAPLVDGISMGYSSYLATKLGDRR